MLPTGTIRQASTHQHSAQACHFMPTVRTGTPRCASDW
jgi:hypothetical protein